MSSLPTIIKDESLASTLRTGLFSLAACSVIGLAAYVGYRAAGPDQKYVLRNRRPESNDQVGTSTYRSSVALFTIRRSTTISSSSSSLSSYVTLERRRTELHDAMRRHFAWEKTRDGVRCHSARSCRRPDTPPFRTGTEESEPLHV